jgi:hypothetical protein
MNLFSLFAMLLLVTQAPINAPRQGGNQQDHATHDATKGDTTSPPLAHTPVEFMPVFQAPKWEPKYDPAQQKSGYWKEAFWPAYAGNWALVLVGGIAGWLAWRTLNAIKRQTDIQSAAMQQWIDVTAITVSNSDLTDGMGKEEKYAVVRIEFDATNNTAYPLKIKEIAAKISTNRLQGKEQWKPVEMLVNVTLPPSGTAKRNFYPFFIPAFIEGGKVEDFLGGHLYCTISGRVYFRDCLGVDQEQLFGGIYVCAPNKVTVVSHRVRDPETHEAADQKG